MNFVIERLPECLLSLPMNQCQVELQRGVNAILQQADIPTTVKGEMGNLNRITVLYAGEAGQFYLLPYSRSYNSDASMVLERLSEDIVLAAYKDLPKSTTKDNKAVAATPRAAREGVKILGKGIPEGAKGRGPKSLITG